MNNQSSIKYISALLDNPGTLTEGDQSSIALFRQSFPYFLPARYMTALDSHKKLPYNPEMLSAMQPYLGDWILFCDLLDTGVSQSQYMPAADSIVRVVDKKKVDVQRVPEDTLSLPVSLSLPEEAPKPVADTLPVEEAAVEPAKHVEPITEAVQPQEAVHEALAAPVEEIIDNTIVEHTIEPLTRDAAIDDVHVTASVTEPDVEVHEEAEKHPAASFSSIIAEAIADSKEKPGEEPQQPVITAAHEEESAPQLIAVEPETVAEAGEPEVTAAPVAENIAAPVAAVEEPPVFIKPVIQYTDIEEPAKEPVAEAPSPAVFIADIKETLSANVPVAHEQHIDIPPVEEIIAGSITQQPSAPVAEVPEHIETIVPEVIGESIYEPAIDPDQLIFPIYTRDYFLQQGEKVSEEIPLEIEDLKETDYDSEEDKSLMIVMSFSEWLLHFKNSAEKQKEETKDQRALKTMWQKEKLAAAMEEENEEIPENVFEMAVNSIAKEEGLVSDTLAEIYMKQGKYDKAIEMFRKLSLRNPQKSVYFARKIEEALKDIQS